MIVNKTKLVIDEVISHKYERSRMQLNTSDIKAANHQLKLNAYKLFIYYFEKKQGWHFSDTEMMKALGISAKSLQRARKELIDLGYLRIVKTSSPTNKVTNYFIGKSAVAESLAAATPPSETGAE